MTDGFMDPNQTVTPNTVAVVVDTGEGLTMINVPIAGVVELENIRQAQDQFPLNPGIRMLPEKITHVVLKIPVFANPHDGSYYTVRNVTNGHGKKPGVIYP